MARCTICKNFPLLLKFEKATRFLSGLRRLIGIIDDESTECRSYFSGIAHVNTRLSKSIPNRPAFFGRSVN